MSVLGYKVTFNNKQKEFFNALKQEVDAYFERNAIKKQATGSCMQKQLF